MARRPSLAEVLGVQVKTKGKEKTVTMLEQLGVRAGDVRKVSGRVRKVYIASEKRRFDSDGPGWPPLRESTVARKARGNLDPRIMRARGDLAASLTQGSGPQQIKRKRRDGYQFGTKIRYAIFHQEGRGVDERLLVEMSDSDTAQMNDVLQQFIVTGEGADSEL